MKHCDRTIHELQELIRSRQVLPSEVTASAVERVNLSGEALNTFITPMTDEAMTLALDQDERLNKGETLGPLAGIPIGLKDIFLTRGIRTTCASKMLHNYIPPYTGTAAARVLQHDGVVIGKLNMDEFAMGSSNENSAFGPVRNPWDMDRTPGGSSGGSAAAVAAGHCIAALGTDTGGSIRQPAALTGICGLKPTYGRVSRYGVIAFASSLDQVGPMARDVEDVAILYQCIAGHDPFDSTSSPRETGDVLLALRKDLKGVRLGIPREYFIDGMDPEVEAAVRKSLEVMQDLGATLLDISLPHTEYAVPVYYLVATAEASSNLARFDGVRYGYRAPEAKDLKDIYAMSRGQGFGDEVKRRIMLGTYALSAGYYDAFYLKAQQVRALITRDFMEAFGQVDAIITPTSPTAAFRIGERVSDPLQMYLGDIFTIPCNLAGLPGLSMPCGFTASGLPIGVQVLGKPFDEAGVLSVGRAYQQATDWHLRRPPIN